MNKIGVAIITCERVDYLNGLLDSINKAEAGIDRLIIVDDGQTHSLYSYSKADFIYHTSGRIGVGKAKNIALKNLYDEGCDYIFVIEDDMLILDQSVFKQYIEASKASGIQHFNYGPGSPFNRKQVIQHFDLHNRHLLDQSTEPNPKLIVDYKTCKIALYEHTVAMFSFFTREVIDKVGYIDEEYDQCWEHVDHTYNIYKAGYHTPFWWFADLANSHELLTEAPNAIENSAIAKDKSEWMKKVTAGREIYLKKHGHYPNQPPFVSKEQVIENLKQLKNDHSR